MNTLKFIQKRYQCDFNQQMPINIPRSRLVELPKLFRKLGFKRGAEIGVSTGRYSNILLKNIPQLEMLYCVDPWMAYDEYVEQHGDFGKEDVEKCYQKAMGRLNLYNNKTILRKTSMEALKDIPDNSLDFVFIDGNHTFEYVVNDIAEWSKKVRPGGIISGHDYWTSSEEINWLRFKPTEQELLKLCQVKDVVDAWTKANKITPWFVLTNEQCPSWFWVKP